MLITDDLKKKKQFKYNCFTSNDSDKVLYFYGEKFFIYTRMRVYVCVPFYTRIMYTRQYRDN